MLIKDHVTSGGAIVVVAAAYLLKTSLKINLIMRFEMIVLMTFIKKLTSSS
jgi:hypothetical protein